MRTAHGDIPMSVQAMKAGAVDFLTKPVRDQTLLDAIAIGIERDVKQRAQSGIAYRAVALQGLNRLLTAYNLLDAAFERSGLARWFGTFLITSGSKL